MMWLAICLPFMVLGTAVAVVPVLWGTFRFHRGADDATSATADAQVAQWRRMLSVHCPVCAGTVTARSDVELVDEVKRHAWRAHGIPSDLHILESAKSA